MNLLLLGASGLVGRYVLADSLSHPVVSHVIAPSRKPLPVHAKLTNPVAADIGSLVKDLPAWKPDALICCLGTTMAKAGSQEAFRQVDYVLPLLFARAARSYGATTMGLVTFSGASPDSRFFYARTKGELERDILALDFPSLTIVRPGMIGGQRDEIRRAEHAVLGLLRVLGPLVPSKFRINPAPHIAGALLEAVTAPLPGNHFRQSESLV